MTIDTAKHPRIGLLFRGDRTADPHATSGATRLEPLMAELGRLNVTIELVVYEDDEFEAVRDQLLGLDGVLVWVNPIQDGANRSRLDALLRETSSSGVWVSAHPDVIRRLGTKEVLFETRHLGWGSAADLYRDAREFERRFPLALARDRVRVVKQARGNGGNGVWRVALVDRAGSDDPPGPDALVEVQQAWERREGVSERIRLGEFFVRCEEYFAWSGCLVDQPFQERLAEGMIRCYFVHDVVVGFSRQWPKALLDPASDAARQPTRPSTYLGPEAPDHQALRQLAEREWVPQMKEVLGLDTFALPAIWDADFLYGAPSDSGVDSYVLCEINVSAVWPFPDQAVEPLAQAAVARIGGRSAGPEMSDR